MLKEIRKITKRGEEIFILNKRGLVVSIPMAEKESFEKIGKMKNMPSNPPQLIKDLADLGILVFKNYKPQSAKTAEYDDALLRSNDETPVYPAPLIAHFTVTNACNMRCAYCSVRNFNKNYSEPDTQTCKKIIRKLSNWGAFQIGLTGGEPTLRKDLAQLINYTLSLGNACNITTNGWLLDNKMVSDLKAAGLSQAQVSLDSHLETVHDRLRGKGSFERALRAIKLLQKEGIAVGADCVVSKNNIVHIWEMINFLNKQNIAGLTLIKLKKGDLNMKTFLDLHPDYLEYSNLIDGLCKRKNINPEVTIDCGSVSNLQYTLTEEEIKKLHSAGCPIGHTLISVATNGDLYPCAALASKEFVLGNILKDDPSKIWLSSPILKDLRNIKKKITGKCKKCERLNSCRGGCRGIAYCAKGLFASDPFCQRIPKNFTIKVDGE